VGPDARREADLRERLSGPVRRGRRRRPPVAGRGLRPPCGRSPKTSPTDARRGRRSPPTSGGRSRIASCSRGSWPRSRLPYRGERYTKVAGPSRRAGSCSAGRWRPTRARASSRCARPTAGCRASWPRPSPSPTGRATTHALRLQRDAPRPRRPGRAGRRWFETGSAGDGRAPAHRGHGRHARGDVDRRRRPLRRGREGLGRLHALLRADAL
jgi:hypothetical protein